MVMTAQEAYAEAERRIEEARDAGAETLDLSNLESLRMLPDLTDLDKIRYVRIDHAQISDISPITSVSCLQRLFLNGTQVADLAPLISLTDIEALYLAGTQVSDVSPLRKLLKMQSLYLDNTSVSNIEPLKKLEHLHILGLNGTQVADLRPIAQHPFKFGVSPISHGLHFKNTPAASAKRKLTRLSRIEDHRKRTDKTLAYLRTLPPYPAPLPWEVPKAADAPGTPPEPEPDGTLPLTTGDDGTIGFGTTTTPLDPIIEAVIEDVRPLLDALARKGNLHEDVFALATELKKRCAGEIGDIDLLRLHLSYQKLNRLYLSRETRADPFDDELTTTLAAVTQLLPGATLGEPKVGELIARQEANRAANTPAVVKARAIKVLEAIEDPDAPFEPDLRDLAHRIAEPDQDDRLSGTAMILTRNVLIYSLKVVSFTAATAASGIIGGWAYAHSDVLLSFALGLGDDFYWWAKAILDKLKAALESRGFGP